MQKIISVSLGSSRRDHETELQVMDKMIQIARQGTDGNLAMARSRIAALDGTVDAIGLGGIDRYLIVGGRRYEIADARSLAQAAQKTPVVDGSGLKAVWERHVVHELLNRGQIHTEQRVLLVSALDRFGMAQAFYETGFPTTAGDLIFASHIDYPICSLGELEEIGRKLLPDMVKMPFTMLYPTGSAQDGIDGTRDFGKYFEESGIIAGDFHFIRRYLPDNLEGKTMITNTTTAEDRGLLAARGLSLLVTTTPVIAGRSFGTNVIEAALVAASGVLPEDPAWEDMVMAAGLRFDVTTPR